MGFSGNRLPEELVAEILLRLPTEALFRCKLLSKQWKSRIAHPKFAQTYLQRCRSSTSVHVWQSVWQDDVQRYPNMFEIGPAKDQLSRIANGLPGRNKDKGVILASSNGLILSCTLGKYSCHWYWFRQEKLEFFVSNPLNKQSVQLPCLSLPNSSTSKCALGFATSRQDGDDEAAFVYKVVFILPLLGRPVVADSVDSTVEIFSSDSGSWTAKKLLSCPNILFNCHRKAAFTYKGILHWFDYTTRTIVTYDPYCSSSPDQFGLIRFPLNGSDKVRAGMILLGHEEVLKYGEIEVEQGVLERRVRVWRLVDYDNREWCLEQTFAISPKDKLCPSKCIRMLTPDLWIHKCAEGCLFEVSSDPAAKDIVLLAPLNTIVTLVPSCWSFFYGQVQAG